MLEIDIRICWEIGMRTHRSARRSWSRLLGVVVVGGVAARGGADIVRWDNLQVIPDTQGITPDPAGSASCSRETSHRNVPRDLGRFALAGGKNDQSGISGFLSSAPAPRRSRDSGPGGESDPALPG